MSKFQELYVGNCPTCNSAIPKGFSKPRCPSCGDLLPASILAELANALNPVAQTAALKTNHVENATPTAAALLVRYREAYGLATSTVGTGSLIRQVGIAVSVMGALFGILVGMAIARESVAAMILGAVLGLGLGATIYSIGALMMAQGQMLLGVLDSAVNSSPFLSPDHKAEIMRLPPPPGTR